MSVRGHKRERTRDTLRKPVGRQCVCKQGRGRASGVLLRFEI